MPYFIGKVFLKFWWEMLIFVLVIICLTPFWDIISKIIGKKIQHSNLYKSIIEKETRVLNTLLSILEENDIEKIDHFIMNNKQPLGGSIESLNKVLPICAQFNLKDSLEYFTTDRFLATKPTLECINYTAQIAILHNHLDILEYIISLRKSYDIDLSYLCLYAISIGKYKALEQLINHSDCSDMNQVDIDNAFWKAVENNDMKCMEILCSEIPLLPSQEIIDKAILYFSEKGMEERRKVMEHIKNL